MRRIRYGCVLPASVVCNIVLTDLSEVKQTPTGGCEVTLADLGTNQPVGFTLYVTNTGQADLAIYINGLPPLFDCGFAGHAIVPDQGFTLAAGQTTAIGPYCTLADCSTTFSVTVQGRALQTESTGIECVFDSTEAISGPLSAGRALRALIASGW